MAALSRGRWPARAPWLRRAGLLLAAVLAVLLTTRLGFWQLDRARQKVDLQARMQARAALPPLAQVGLARSAPQAEAQHYRRIQLRGRWQADATVYLDNRQMNARPGFFVVTPLLLDDGDAVLVQRGWKARDCRDRSRLAAPPTATGEVVVVGRIAPPPSKLFQLGGTDSGPIRQNLDLAGFAAETGLALRPLSVQQLSMQPVPVQQMPAPQMQVQQMPVPQVPVPQMPVPQMPMQPTARSAAEPVPAAAADNSLLRQWSAPAVDVGKHHGYAFQWFALAALIVGLCVWFQLLRPFLARYHAQHHARPL